MKKVVINVCFGGFGLSDEAYEKLIEYGIPRRKYIKEERNPKTGLYDKKVNKNEGEVIFDRELTQEGEDSLNDIYHKYKGQSRFADRYWEVWASENREHPLVIKVIEELGEKANGSCAKLKIIELPDDVDYEISEYDGNEHIAEKHRTWS